LPHETLPRDVPLGGGVNPCTTFKGHRPLKIWKVKKRSKFVVIWDNFWLWPQISLEQIEISTSGYQLPFIPRWTKKSGELWSINHKVVFAHFHLPNIDSACIFGQLSTL